MKFKRSKIKKNKRPKTIVDMRIVQKAQEAVYLKILHNVEDITGVDLFHDNVKDCGHENIFMKVESKSSESKEEKSSITQFIKKGSSFSVKEREVIEFPNPRLARA